MATKKPAAPASTAGEKNAAADAAASTEPAGGDVPSANAKSTKPSTPARFASDYASLIVYAKGKKVATFVLGELSSDDPTVIAVLRGHELVREVVEGASDDRS